MNRLIKVCAALVFLSFVVLSTDGLAWPLDDADSTKIRRLAFQRQAASGEFSIAGQPPGARLASDDVDVRLPRSATFDLPGIDPGFTRSVVTLLADRADDYSVAVLDLTDPTSVAYAEHRAAVHYSPASLGKLLIALSWLQALADHYGDDYDARWRNLRALEITADDLVSNDHHKIIHWDRTQATAQRRPLMPGDRGSLIEYLDWMISASSNGAGSMLLKHGMLWRRFGAAFPPDAAAGKQYFEGATAMQKSALLRDTLNDAVLRNGFNPQDLYQGSFFTRGGRALVAGESSRANARELMRFLLHLEQGRLVDGFSSRVLKKLLYVTERRVRYAAAPALADAAVYFKGGSWYRCEEEAGFECGQYRGNVINLMHSMAIVEAPAQSRRLHYLVVVMSNALRRNAAYDHQQLASAIHGLIEARNRASPPRH